MAGNVETKENFLDHFVENICPVYDSHNLHHLNPNQKKYVEKVVL